MPRHSRHNAHGGLYAQMKHNISFYSVTSGSNNKSIAAAPSESLVLTCPAAMRSMRSNEATQGDRILASRILVFTVRYNSLLDDASLILRYNNQDYDIETPDDLYGDNAFMEIQATRKT